MILSAQLLMSDAQAIVATAASTNTIDNGAAGTAYGAQAAQSRDIGPGEPVPVILQVVETFNNLTSLQIDLETDDNSGFSSAKVLASETLLLADLVAGKQVSMLYMPQNVERYVRVNYTVVGTAPTTGKVTAGVTGGLQTNFQ